jgi:beta-N-acetylhexosaminidase
MKPRRHLVRSQTQSLFGLPLPFIRQIFAALILLLINPIPAGLAAPPAQSDSARERAQALLSGLTPEERVGQLFLVTFAGADAGNGSQIFDLIVNHHIGGVVLQSENDNFASPPQTLNQALLLVRELQTSEWAATQTRQIEPITNQEFNPAFIPLLVGVSQEGNGAPYDELLHGLTPLPSQMALGATWDTDMAGQAGNILGSELSALGINLLLGPSLDVLENPRQQGTGDLGVRTFGGDPYWVGEMGRAFVSGVHTGSAGRIAVVGKHFPGHGSSDRLPEEEVATVPKSLEQLKLIELPPFYAVTGNAPSKETTVDALLASHIRYQGFQGNIRETTRPVSLDRQAFDQLMSLPALAAWRDNGGVMISDDLGSFAFRRFVDPTGLSFRAQLFARDAFVTGNDLLFLGPGFISTTDPEPSYYNTILRTLAFFAQKYRDDVTFQQRVDESALRILTLKFRIYNDIFTLNQVLPSQNGLSNVGESDEITFAAAQNAATLISPSLADLAETLPEPPNLNDRIVFITDARIAQQCSQCLQEPVFAVTALEQAVMRLYGPLAGGQVLQRNLESYTFDDLELYLDNGEQTDLTDIEANLQQSNWIVFAMLNVSTNAPASQALSRFLAERPDLFRQKKLVVFAFDAPYYLDATEVSKLNAYYGLYSKTPQFVEIAARLLFGELPAPAGDLPVSVPGVDYDLISATAPDPAQVIQLFLDRPEPGIVEDTATPEPTPSPEFVIGDLIAVRTGTILDHNGHPVPDDTPVQFYLTVGGEIIPQNATTRSGIARTTFLVEISGTLEIRAESIDAKDSTVIRFDIPPEGGLVTGAASTSLPTESPSPAPSPTLTPTVQLAPQPASNDQTDLGDWILALLVTGGIASGVYWLTALFGIVRWGIRAGFLALIGGLLAYTYLAFGMPGSSEILQSAGTWGVLLITVLGASVGWGAAWGWQQFEQNAKG